MEDILLIIEGPINVYDGSWAKMSMSAEKGTLLIFVVEIYILQRSYIFVHYVFILGRHMGY